MYVDVGHNIIFGFSYKLTAIITFFRLFENAEQKSEKKLDSPLVPLVTVGEINFLFHINSIPFFTINIAILFTRISKCFVHMFI